MSTMLRIGTHFGTLDPAYLLPQKLNRHTFWCGQSGSGKTYALGVLLEQVLVHTKLPIVVLDPNSDFVRLNELRAGADSDTAAALAERDIRVLHSRADSQEHPAGTNELARVKFLNMSLAARAALLQIDPLRDAEEYNAMIKMEHSILAGIQGSLAEWLRGQNNPVYDRIATRLENLGLLDLDVWAWGQAEITEVLDARADATVVDLGGFSHPIEAKAAALSVLDHLWEHRADRIGRLIVIDEAHNLCAPNPTSDIDRLLTERIVQIAAEGRKYGLWLLLSTQRPSKVHPNALSQCDNLGLMKMSSPGDLEEIARVFGYAPPKLLAQASSFVQGQVLFSGGFSPEPQLVQMADRLTEEGGADVRIPLR